VIAAGAVYAYSFPGLIWLAGTAAVYCVIARPRNVGRNWLAAQVVLLVLIAPELARLIDFSHFKAFSSDKKKEFGAKYGATPLFEHHTTSLIFNDPPLHTRVRRAIVGAISQRHIAAMEPGLVKLVDGLLAAMSEKREVDLIDDFADQTRRLPDEGVSTVRVVTRPCVVRERCRLRRLGVR